MSTTVVVEHERQRFVWDGTRWYNELDYSVPRYSLIRILEKLISAKDRREMAVAAHSEFLSARGMPQSATGKPKKSSHRVASCPICSRKFGNAVELECAACHWIICVCGACGCG
jgi:hypothetical protein